MELYLLRHGAAEDPSLPGSDRARRLTADGIIALRRTLQRVAALGVRPAVILSSPYRRAMETANIAAEILQYGDPILQARSLEPDSSSDELWNEVRLHSDAAAVLVVSHEPLLSSTLAWVTGASEAPAGFPAGGLARVDVDAAAAVPRGNLLWTPRAE